MSDFEFSKYVTCRKDGNVWCLYNWKEHSRIDIDDEQNPLYVYLNKFNSYKNFKLSKLSQDDMKLLIEEKIILENANYLIEKVECGNSKDNSDSSLFLIILPSGEYCNFDCSYCYQSHLKKEFMNENHLNSIYNMIDKQSPEILFLEYFGGEPMLNLSFIKKLNSSLIQRFQSVNKSFYASMTTNGYLLSKKNLNELYKAQIFKLQITLDGIEEDHDKFRRLKNGGATHSVILNNLRNSLDYLTENNFTITIRVNFNEKTATDEKRKQFLDSMEDLGQSPNFNFKFHPISDFSSLNNFNNTTDSLCSKIYSNELQKQFEIEAFERNFQLADLSFFSSKRALSCYAGKENSFIISPDYSIKKCTIALDNEINHVGTLLQNGEIIKNENWYKWINPNPDDKDKCIDCFLSYYCNSNACPLHNMIQKKTICPPAVNNFEHYLKFCR